MNGRSPAHALYTGDDDAPLPGAAGTSAAAMDARWPDERVEALIARQAQRTPDRIAAVSQSGALTFGELERLSNRLARRLVGAGIGPGGYVVVSFERDHLVLVAILAVLKVGAAFVPVELPEPQARLARTCDHAEVTWVLTDVESVAAFERTGLDIMLVDLAALREGDADDAALASTGTPSDPAYGIPTSGSTGTPKTVIVAHRPVRRLIEWIADAFRLGPGDTGLWISPASFDLSIFDLLGLPALGASVRMLSRAARVDPAASADVLLNEPITFWNSTPSLLQAVLPFVRHAPRNRSRNTLRLVFVSGDWCPLTLCDDLRAVFPNARLISLGGATEATVWSNFHAVDRVAPHWNSIPYGRAIPQARYYILDDALRPRAAGVSGELYIGGDCLALGYLGDEELTRRRFVPDPFAGDAGARMYRTGDAARIWEDGTIELLGRVDRQVNVSGYRVDLAEVETALRRAGLANAVAVALPNVGGTLRLAAAGTAPDATAAVIRERLREWLPTYMIPDRVLLTDRLPLTANGKVDREAVAALLRADGALRVAAPAGPAVDPATASAAHAEIEAFLRREIAAILDRQVNGFAADQPLGELGLNSLGFAVLSGRIFEGFGLRMSPVDFYAAGTLTASVARIAGLQSANDVAAAPRKAAPGDPTDPATPAVIGMSCRFPGANSQDELWRCLIEGRDCIRQMPEERARLAGIAQSDALPGGYLDEVDRFDARLLGITPREAGLMDPRQRLLLEAVWTAIEHAGERVEQLKGTRVGVFVGATGDDFSRMSLRDVEAIQGHTLTGTAPAILANRISYVFDLRGPSEVIDTACSSSLVALHRAVAAMREGDCDAAIVAGVSLMLDPATGVALHRIGMLSPDGHCRTFDAAANGYARGEGVGVVYLKPLGRARADGSRIHARVIASAANHGGRTVSLTAPSPEAQRDVIRRCYQKAGIDPRTIGMIEAHGTGTALGDPIETQALVDAFRDLAVDRAAAEPHCALTAVKTNIGHLEAASGIAGLIKAVLSVQHGVVPPLANFERPNTLIDLKDTPFFLCTAPTAWPARYAPSVRRAGISSFGFGGANVHVVVEADAATPAATADDGVAPGEPHAIVLSGPDEATLCRYAVAFVVYFDEQLAKSPEARDSLAAIARTSRRGRSAMAVRLACVASSLAEARETLQAFVDGRADVSGSLVGPERRALSVAAVELAPAADWRGRLISIARRWVAGETPPWGDDMPDLRGSVAAIPTYPFERVRHWLLPTPGTSRGNEQTDGRGVLPLGPDAEIVRAHRVAGRVAIPAALFLTIYQRLFRELTGAWTVRLERVRFLANVETDAAPAALGFAWRREGDAWDVTLSEPDSGRVLSRARLHRHAAIPALPDDDRGASRGDAIEADACYRRLSKAGVDLDAPLRTVRHLRVGGAGCEADLASEHPSAADGGADARLVDGAMQAALLWQLHGGSTGGLPVPVSIDAATFAGPLGSNARAVLHEAAPSAGGRSAARITDVTIFDGAGRVSVRLEGLAAARVEHPSEPPDGVHCFTRAYRAAAARDGTAGLFDILVDGSRELAAALAARGHRVSPLDAGTAMHAEDAGPIREAVRAWRRRAPAGGAPTAIVIEAGRADWRAYVTRLHALLLGAQEIESPCRVVAVCGRAPHPAEMPSLAIAIAALARSLRQEHPHLRVTAVQEAPDARGTAGSDAIADVVVQALADASDVPELLFDAARGVLAPSLVPARTAMRQPVFKPRGAYLISGGLGGVGSALARSLLEVFDARVVLCGRSAAQTPRVVERLAALRQYGEVHYLEADVSRADDALRLVGQARSLMGPLDGVIHCAGVVSDRLFVRSAPADLLDMISSRVVGAMNLHRATRDEPLDLFAMCSSLVASTGGAGMTGYGFACGLLEAFAHRAAERADGRCHTVAVAWGPWAVDGMQMPQRRRAQLAADHGLAAIAPHEGLAALSRAASLHEPVVIAVRGDRDRLIQWLSGTLEQAAPVVGNRAGAMRDEGRPEQAKLDRAVAIVLQAIAAETGLSLAEIDPAARFETYGLDSTLIVAITERLEQTFGDLPMTLFFEYRAVNELAGYLVRAHGAILDECNKPSSAPAPEATPGDDAPAHEARAAAEDDNEQYRAEDIAVIGMAGQFPQAEDIGQFWRNLVAGRDCVEHVPADRWDWRDYGDEGTPGRWGGFIDGWDRFDHAFFAISPAEAELMDPQERLFLQCVYHALEDAGYPPPRLAERAVGVYAGVMWSQYQLYGVEAANVGSSYGSIAHRVSHFFDFTGPSLALDTMCSSSLTAIHLACESLRKGETAVAVAGGVNLDVHPNKHQFLVKRHFASPDGRCRSFGAGGDGYVPGEGVAALILKPMRDALRDGDRIYGVIKGSALNHGGHARGYTVPNPLAETGVIRAALADAAVDAATLGYVEAHGTGTALGDPIEVRALTDALGPEMPACPIGSVKSNVGHLESAAGAAGVIKVLLQMRARALVPSIHADPPNEHIRFGSLPLYVQMRCEPWLPPLVRRDGTLRAAPRRAGISSFGAGGANAHVVVEEAPLARSDAAAAPTERLVVLSARDSERLQDNAAALLGWLQDVPDEPAAGDADEAGRVEELLLQRLSTMLGRATGDADRDRTLRQLGLSDDEALDCAAALARSMGLGDTILSAHGSIRTIAGEMTAALRDMRPRHSLADISYTSLRAREPLRERLAVVAQDVDELAECLEAYLRGEARAGLVTGTQPRTGARGEALRAGAAPPDLHELAAMWCAGAEIDWRALFASEHRTLTDQPNYPFARTRCWVATPGLPELGEGASPHLARAEHAVTLPAERTSARRAARLIAALATLGARPQASYRLDNVTLRLDGEMPTEAVARIAYARGDAHIIVAAQDAETALLSAIASAQVRAPRIDAAAARALPNPIAHGDDVASGTLELRVIGDQDRVVAAFRSAAGRAGDHLTDLFAFIFDAARRLLGSGSVPGFDVESLWFRGTQAPSGTIVISRGSDGGADCLVIQDGDPIAMMRNLRVAQDWNRPAAAIARAPLGRITYEIVYRGSKAAHALLSDASAAPPIIVDPCPNDTAYPRNSQVIHGGAVKASLAVLSGVDTLVFLAPRAPADGAAAVSCFCRVVEFLRDAQHGFARLIVLTEAGHAARPDEFAEPYAALFLGLARAAIRELPRVDVRLVDVARGETRDLLRSDRALIPLAAQVKEYILRGSLAYERRIRRADNVAPFPICYRPNGTYVLVGGSGAVGRQMTRHLVEHYKARVAWIGRRSERDLLAELVLPALPRNVAYHQADVCDEEAFGAALNAIEAQWGRIDGLVDLALEFEFRRLADASAEQATALLRAKVQGTRTVLAEASARSPGFVCFMSSAEILGGNAGWGFYAGGCCFQDAMVQAAARDSAIPIRVVNWGYWEGNQRGSAAALAAKGVAPLPVDVGMQALSAAVRDERTQLLVLDVARDALERMGLEEGDAPVTDLRPRDGVAVRPPAGLEPRAPSTPERKTPRAVDAPVAEPQAVTASDAASPAGGGWTLERVEAVLAAALSETLGLAADDIAPGADMAEYGLDSILFLDFAEAIEKHFGRVRVEDLIALDTLRAMSTYILAMKLAPPDAAEVAPAVAPERPPEPPELPEAADVRTRATDDMFSVAELGAAQADAILVADPIDTTAAAPRAAPAPVCPIAINEHVTLIAALPRARTEDVLLRYSDQTAEELKTLPCGETADQSEDGFRHYMVAAGGGTTVEVMTCGSGPTLLLIPGIGLTAPVFHAQFVALSRDWRVVALHSPGHGRSAPPNRATTAALAETIETTLRRLDATLPVHVVASCFSTVAAQYLAAHRPDVVASLTLCGASTEGVAIPTIPPEGLSARDVAQLTEMASKSLVADFESLAAAPQNARVRDYIDECCRLLLRSQKASPAVGMKYLNEVLGLRPSEWAPKIEAPTLFVVGALDTVVPPEATLAAAPRIRRAQVVEIADAGHYPFLTHPAVFNTALAAFLRRVA